MKPKKRYVIGIDPGANTGVAIWDTKEKCFHSYMDFDSHTQGVLFVIKRLHELGRENVKMRIEDARMSYVPAHMRKAGREQGVGGVKALCRDWEKFAQSEHVEYELVSPQANRYKKVNAQLFKQITGIQDRLNSHVRDAAMLVYQYVG